MSTVSSATNASQPVRYSWARAGREFGKGFLAGSLATSMWGGPIGAMLAPVAGITAGSIVLVYDFTFGAMETRTNTVAQATLNQHAE